MDKINALKDFKDTIVQKAVKKYTCKFEENFDIHLDEVRNLILQSLKKLTNKYNQKFKENYKITIFQFEMLKNSILDESFIVNLYCYNEKWCLEEETIIEKIDFKFLFEPFIEMKKVLKNEIKLYYGKIDNYYVQNIVNDAVKEAFINISGFVRFWLIQIEDNLRIEENFKLPFYLVKWSECESISDSILSINKKLHIINTDFKEKDNSCSLKNDEIKDFKSSDMIFINLEDNKFEKVDFSESDIIRGHLNNCYFKDCKFCNSRLSGTILKNAIIENCNFENSSLVNVDFSNTTLNNVKFKNCDLSDSVFLGATFKSVDFENVQTENTLFAAKDIANIHINLTAEQSLNIQ